MDLNSALAQTSGDEAALVNLCGAFANGFRSFSAEYTEAVTDQNALKLETLTHKVKGASRYIGDIEVHELAQRLEAEVRAGTLPKTKELGDLVALRIEVLTPLIRQRSSAQDYATPQSEIKKLTSEFLAAYSDNCFIPPNEWKPYIAGLKTTGMIETAEQLQSAIEANAFEEAAAVLTEIKAGLE
jgi:HPt (histidine-containing phosphotransfer) domain-containing protein